MTNRVIVNARPFGLHGDGGYGGNLGYDSNNAKKITGDRITGNWLWWLSLLSLFSRKNIYVGLSY